jgi:hypothetical protein
MSFKPRMRSWMASGEEGMDLAMSSAACPK